MKMRMTHIITAGCVAAFTSLPLHVHAQLSEQWQAGFGGMGYDECTTLYPTADGGCVVAGGSESGATGNKSGTNYGDADYWFVKMDADGNKVWDHVYGGNDLDYANGVQPTSDGGWLLAGQSISGATGNKTNANFGGRDFWLVKTDVNGVKQWEREFGGSTNDTGWCIASSSNSYLLGGWSLSGVSGNKSTPNQGWYDWWVVSVDTNGIKQWDASFGGDDGDYLYDAQPTADGGFILIGESYSPGATGNKTSPNYGSGYADGWIVKIDGSGTKQWEHSYGGTNDDWFEIVVALDDGGYLVGGSSYSDTSGNKSSPNMGYADWWLLRLDSSGNKLWEQDYGGDQSDYLWAILPMEGGGFLLHGTSWSDATGNKDTAGTGNSDYWLMMVDDDGNKQWEQAFGGTNTDYAVNAFKPSSDGGLLLGGYSLSGMTGNKTVSNYGDFDFWVIKLALPELPYLMIEPMGAGQLSISWAPATTGFVLQETPDLTVSNSWSNSPSMTNNPATVPATNPASFFRLYKP